MSEQCCAPPPSVDPVYRRVLWLALVINVAMFAVEIVAGTAADSVALLADAVDFLGDAGNYAISLAVLSLAPVWRSRTALLKGISMAAYGVFVLGKVVWNLAQGVTPDAATMGVIAALALLANFTVAAMLYRFREGDADRRSVWLCTRNDVLGNLAVMLAALGVFGTGTAWPDLAVAIIMAMLGLSAARTVIAAARAELRLAR